MNDKKFSRALVALKRAYQSLAVYGPDRTRRGRALVALRALRAAVDEFPVVIKRRKPVRLKSFEGRCERLTRVGWQRVDELAGNFAAAGVPVRRVSALSGAARRLVASGTWDSAVPEVAFFVPAWAVAIGPDKPSALRAAKGNLSAQREALAVAALGR